MKTTITASLLLIMTLMSCKSVDQSTLKNDINQTDGLLDTDWVLTELKGHKIATSDASSQNIHFTLHTDEQRVSGNAGCNSIMGTYTLEPNNKISFSAMATTRMACPDSKIKESEVLIIFKSTDTFSVSNGQLVLYQGNIVLATFAKAIDHEDSITEKYWKLKTLNGKAIVMSEGQAREQNFILKSNNNQLTGFAGCNQFSGEFTLEDNQRIRFSQIATTMMACPDLDIDESEFLKVFGMADSYSIKDDVLSLYIGKRTALATFEAVYFN